jgi:hypothetical protein
MQSGGHMPITNAREFFGTLASRGHDPRLADATGSWQFDVDGAGSWRVRVDHGAFDVKEGQGTDTPTTRIQLSDKELIRLANGEGGENLLTAILRGSIRVDGQLRFAHRLWPIIPFPEDWRIQ